MNKYNGIFNYNGEVFNLWTTAKNMGQAKKNFLYQLINKLNLDRKNGYRKLKYYFSGKANYEVKMEN